MTANGTAIAILLISFLVMIFLRFPHCLCSGIIFPLMSVVSAAALYHHLSADGKRHQLLQSDGGSFLYYYGMPDGIGWYFGETDRPGGCLCRMDDRRYGHGEYRGILFLRWNFRFCISRYCFSGKHSDPYDGRAGL